MEPLDTFGTPPSNYNPQSMDYRDGPWKKKYEDNTSMEAHESNEEDIQLSPRFRQRLYDEHKKQSYPSELRPQTPTGRIKKKRRRKWPPPILALEFQRTSPADTMAWLVLRLQDPLEDGGVEAYVRIVPPLKDLGTTLLLSSSTELVMKVALVNRLRVWQPKFSGPFRDECDSCKTGTVDSGLVTSEKQRLLLHAIQRMPILVMEATAGIPGREQVELETGQPILSHVLQTEIVSRLYPLHEPEKLDVLNQMNWVMAFTDDTNWDGVREYFGLQVAIHFFFCSTVIRAMLVMSTVVFTGIALAWIWDNPRAHVGVAAMSNLVFAALFPKIWRQRCSKVAPKWGMARWGDPEPPVNRKIKRSGKASADGVTSQWEQDYPQWKRMAVAAALTVPSLFFVLLFSMMMQLNYLNLQETQGWWDKNDTSELELNATHNNLASDINRANVTLTEDVQQVNLVFGLPKLLSQGCPWGYWLGFRIMMVLYAAFVVFMGYVVRCVVNVTTEWENHTSVETYERIRIFKLASALFAVNFLPLYTTLLKQRNLLRINELLLYILAVDMMVSLIKRHFVCMWVGYCVSMFREGTEPYMHPVHDASSTFMTGLRQTLNRRSPRLLGERRRHSVSPSPSTEDSSSSSSPSELAVSPRGGISHTCRPPSPPPSIPALHKCLAPPPDEQTIPMIRVKHGNVGQWVTTVGRAEKRVWESQPDPALLPFEGWFEDHDEVLMRFSRYFMFPAMYIPLILVSILGSVALMDADGKMLCQALQRPVATIERGLGQSWQVALEVISWLILLSNGAILYFSFAEQGKGLQKVSWILSLAVAGVMAVCIKLIVMHMLPDGPLPPPARPTDLEVLQEHSPQITCRRRPFPVER